MPNIFRFFIAIFIGCVFASQLVLADDQSQVSETPTPTPAQQKAAQMDTIQREILWLQQEIEQHHKDLASAGKDEINDLKDEVTQLEAQLQRARLSFIAIVSDVDLPTPEPDNQPKKRDLVQEAQQFIEPLFDAIHRVSEKPRRIESYRTKSFNLSDRLMQTDKAINHLDSAIKTQTYPKFSQQLVDSRTALSHSRDDIQVQLDTLQRKLSQEESDHRTVVQFISEEIQDFISTRGKNLLISILVFTAVFWGLLFIRPYLFQLKPVRSKIHGASKPIQIIYSVLAALFSIMAVILTLHFLNDWFMVTLLMVILVAVVWSSKTFISHFLVEVRLALNLGTVRLGERVVWQGVPWRVKDLGFRSVLVNEALQGGMITLPAAILVTMQSRPVVESEPWFPSLVGDFVLLDDGNYGQVETQTPETVVLNTGSTRKHYATISFLSKNPQNFSNGFELSSEFVFRHLPLRESFEKLRSELSAAVSLRLANRLQSSGPDLAGFKVAVHPSGTNMTRVFLSAGCSGKLASQRDDLRRELQVAIGEAWREVAAKLGVIYPERSA